MRRIYQFPAPGRNRAARAAFSPHHKGWIYASLCEGSNGAALWLSKDGGKKWEPFETLPFRNIQRIEFDPDDEDDAAFWEKYK